jgi:phosphinothricin acetyltransferase
LEADFREALMDLQIRPGESGDLNRLVEIYNYYVTETHVTFDTEAFVVGSRTQWFTQFAETGPYRLLVAESGGEVLGYATSTVFKPRPAYNTSVESTVYLDSSHLNEGLGTRLYAKLIDELIDEKAVHRAYGGVALPNPGSVALHEKLGFVRVGSYHEVGFKFGKFWNVDWFERDVSSS